ncbi:MAG: hydrogenase nickel incorporation protein HypB [Planctomycetota bacterium]
MKINVVESVLKANDAVARENRRRLSAEHLLAVNLMSAPGSGKTTMLEKTIPALGCELPSAVLVGDLQTTRDAERLGGLAVQTTQINTGKGCHLDATQVAQGLDSLKLDGLAYLFIENVGNLVCPAAYDLGEHVRVVLLSVPEGDDKVAKYPTIFQPADIILLTKTDLLGVLDYDIGRVHDDLAKLNARVPLIEISAKSGAGMDLWLTWLRDQRRERCGSGSQKLFDG